MEKNCCHRMMILILWWIEAMIWSNLEEHLLHSKWQHTFNLFQSIPIGFCWVRVWCWLDLPSSLSVVFWHMDSLIFNHRFLTSFTITFAIRGRQIIPSSNNSFLKLRKKYAPYWPDFPMSGPQILIFSPSLPHRITVLLVNYVNSEACR